MARTARLVGVAAVILGVSLSSACGGGSGSSSSPTSPSSSTAAAVPNTYLGTLTVPGNSSLGGFLQLQASQGLLAGSLAPAELPLFNRVWRFVEPRLLAQAGVAATGSLVIADASVIPLAGTFLNGIFTVTGGGYAITATVSGGTITGNGTAPGGQTAQVSSPTPAPVTTPAPADPSGTYKGSFRFDTTAAFVNTGVPRTAINCNYKVAIAGTLTMDVTNRGNGAVDAHLIASWTETSSPGTCPVTGVINIPTSGLDYSGTATSMQFGRLNAGTGPGGTGSLTRGEYFSGAISGNTIVGTVSRSFNFTAPTTVAGETHTEGYPVTGVSVTLTRN